MGDPVLIVVVVAMPAMVRWRADPVRWLLGACFALFGGIGPDEERVPIG